MNEDFKSLSLRIKGIVQGVGFRPFIYSLARKFNLNGFVLNDSEGVFIEVEGKSNSLSSFIESIHSSHPPHSKINDIIISSIEAKGYKEFQIRQSPVRKNSFTLISPDLSICSDCEKELLDHNDRRYRYPFINCTNCGPRFTIIENIPYDREKTSMKAFKMCKICQNEYSDPASRRFHAQPNACYSCGPSLSLFDSGGNKIDSDDLINKAKRLIHDGYIISVKGLGGFHLCCDATNEKAVEKLRARKYREDKPFALMAADIETIRKYCHVNYFEEKLLESAKRPIVLLEKKKNTEIAISTAPNQNTLGFMLPYTPLHRLLFKDRELILIMTSGNVSDEPICHTNSDAFTRLSGISDYFLMHEREIHIRCDDSVTRVFKKKEMILRRSRGYVPNPLLLPFSFKNTVLAVGAELKNTFCFAEKNMVFISHHIGDLENAETFASFENGIEHFKSIFLLKPEIISFDLHPEYLSTKYAKTFTDLMQIPVQHHHAHLVSCMAENNTKDKTIGVIFDGLGYGEDRNLWGGEFLIGDFLSYERFAHFRLIHMPGGTKAITEPWRMAVSMLYDTYGEEMIHLDIKLIKETDKNLLYLIKKMIDKKISSPLTSSAGRIFDAVSALIGLIKTINYEGQAAILLEMASKPETKESYDFFFDETKSPAIIDLRKTIKGIVRDVSENLSVSIISKKFHNTIASVVYSVCRKITEFSGNRRVALSGGVFQNMILLESCHEKLTEHGFDVITHHQVPPNDGGICLGQALIANERCDNVSSNPIKSLEH